MQNVNTESVIRYVGESEQKVIDSRDVAKMIGKTHKNLMRDIRSYINDLEESSKLSPRQFFIESSYISAQNKELPCYNENKRRPPIDGSLPRSMVICYVLTKITAKLEARAVIFV